MWLCRSCSPLSWSHRWCCGWVGAAGAHKLWKMSLSLFYFGAHLLTIINRPTGNYTKKLRLATSHQTSSLISYTINPMVDTSTVIIQKGTYFQRFSVRLGDPLRNWLLFQGLSKFGPHAKYETEKVNSLFLLLHWLQLRSFRWLCFLTSSSCYAINCYYTQRFPAIDPNTVPAPPQLISLVWKSYKQELTE